MPESDFEYFSTQSHQSDTSGLSPYRAPLSGFLRIYLPQNQAEMAGTVSIAYRICILQFIADVVLPVGQAISRLTISAKVGGDEFNNPRISLSPTYVDEYSWVKPGYGSQVSPRYSAAVGAYFIVEPNQKLELRVVRSRADGEGFAKIHYFGWQET